MGSCPDQEGSKKDSTGTKEPTPRGTEAGKTDPSEITNFEGATFEEYRKNAPDYEYSGEGDDRRILPKNTPIDMEKSLPAEVALLIPRAVATQKEAEEAERAALEAIRASGCGSRGQGEGRPLHRDGRRHGCVGRRVD